MAVKHYTIIRRGQPGTSSSVIDYERELDGEQLAVVMAGDGPQLVIAGAGSGKTRTVTYKVARLIESGVKPQRIMLLTFTNKAAREMLARVEALLPTAHHVWGGTFHHIGNRIIRQYGERAGLPHHFTILDTTDAKDMMKFVLAELDIPRDKKFPKAATILELLSFAINTGSTLPEVIARLKPEYADLTEYIAEAANHYTMRKLERQSLDFDDLLTYWLLLLRDKKEIADEIRSNFDYILVDEYQDTNHLQGQIIDDMASVKRNLTVVGDDAQSIYSFRGADFTNILEFPKRWQDARVFYITKNYRSTPEILELANASILHNKRQFKKELFASKPSGIKPVVVPLKDVYEQAAFVVEHILRLAEEGVPLSRIAVLYRSHADSMEIQMELTRRRVPYLVRSGIRFFETAHIKDITSFLKFIYNPRDELSFLRMAGLMEGIAARTASRLFAQVAAQADPVAFIASGGDTVIPPRARQGWQTLRQVIADIAKLNSEGALPSVLISQVMDAFYEKYLLANFRDHNSRKLDIEQLEGFSAHFKNLGDFLSELSLMQVIAGEEVGTDNKALEEYLVLSSIHQAKGLEWKILFLVWCADGRLPLEYALMEDNEEEERRLFYVALTRAEDELYVCYPKLSYDSRGYSRLLGASRFLTEIKKLETMSETWSVEFAEDVEPENKASTELDGNIFSNDGEPVIELDEYGEPVNAKDESRELDDDEDKVRDDEEIPF